MRAAAERGSRHAAVRLLPLLALYVAFSLLATGPLALVKDEPHYLHLAENITRGDYAQEGSDNPLRWVWFGPGLPLMLAPLVAAELPDAAIRLLGPLLLFCAVLLFHRWLRLYCGPRAALAGTYAFALYWPAWILLAHLHSEIAATFLVVAAGYLVSLSVRSGRRLHVAAAALATAWLALTRPEFGLVLTGSLVACAIWWAATRGAPARRLTAVCAVALAACLPWLAYTHSVTGRVAHWSSAGGLSLYWMASPYAEDLGDWHAFGDPLEEPDRPRHRAVFARLDELPVPDRDERLQEVALRRIRERPLLYARNLALNFGRLWTGMPYTGKGFQPQKLLYVLANGLLLLALGLALARIWRARRRVPPEVLPIVLFGGAYLALHVPLSTEPSHLTPFVPIAVWAAVLGLAATNFSGGRIRIGPRPAGRPRPRRTAPAPADGRPPPGGG